MKNRIYPTWKEIQKFHKPLEDGEKRLARFLDDKLPEEWMIFVQPHLNGKTPDIVVFNPQVGVMIYEVKDNNLSSYRPTHVKSFLKRAGRQVNYYKSKIIELLPMVGEEIDKNKSVFGLVKTGIYLHKTSGEYAREFSNGKYPIIIGYDDLNDSKLESILPDISRKTTYMREEWVDEILFWLMPPSHSKERIHPLILSSKQKMHGEPKSGHFRLMGATGSGKTLVIAYRAAKLASQGLKVLVVTFNITLWHHIKDLVRRAPFDDKKNIVYNNFRNYSAHTLHH